MGRNSDIGTEPVTVKFDPVELLGLYSFLALRAHFATIISGENRPLSRDERAITPGIAFATALAGLLFRNCAKSPFRGHQ